MKNRIESLDWLRGIMAVSIMAYHLIGSTNASTILGKLGIYGVLVFFVLSGLSMAVVYNGLPNGIKSSLTFYVRRIFRIWPLLWVCILLVVVPKILVAGAKFDSFHLFLNFSTLFGVFDPGVYINVGAWSIGNEIVYYLMTPLLLMVYNWRVLYGNLILAALFCGHLVFCYHFLDPHNDLASQWDVYIHPLNNAFLYCSGVGIYYNLKGVKIDRWLNVIVASVVLLLFVFFPVSGGQINLVTGANSVMLSMLSVAIVICFYLFESYDAVPFWISFPLERFGAATYGVYLLHPIIFDHINPLLRCLIPSKYVAGLVSVSLVVFVALLSYRFFEIPFIRFGKRFTNRFLNN